MCVCVLFGVLSEFYMPDRLFRTDPVIDLLVICIGPITLRSTLFSGKPHNG